MERVFSRIYHVDEAYQLLLTFGFILILDDAVKIIWGGPSGFRRSRVPRGLVAGIRQIVPGLQRIRHRGGLGVAVLLWALFEKTWWGRIVRASLADREMARHRRQRATGILRRVRVRRDAGGARRRDRHAGARARPGIGAAMIIQAFIITVIGGLGNLKGAFVSSLIVGVLSAYGTLYFPVFELFFIFVIMAVVLLIRPQGLFSAE